MPPYNPHPIPPPRHRGPGREPLSEEARKLKSMTVSQYREAVAVYFSKPISALQDIVKDAKTKSLDVWIAMCILTAAKKGDYMTLDQMLNRIIGKVKEVSSVEMSGPDGGPIVTQGANPELAGFTKDELRKLLETIDAKQNAGADGNAETDGCASWRNRKLDGDQS